jgi:AICAR transformylase/IMP cyclohydrolase PurH
VAGLDENPLACAYVRARGTDRLRSFGDWVALSDVCDELTASLIAPEVSDGVIAPGYTEKALQILKGKRKGSYNVVKIEPNYVPKEEEIKEVFGIAFHQGRNNFKIDEALLSNIVTENKELPEDAPQNTISALAGMIGNLKGISVKTAYSGVISKE